MADGLLAAVEASALASFVRGSIWLYPLVNAAHVLAVGLLFGAVVAADLRLLGASRDLPLRPLLRHTLTLAWAGFALAAASGPLLFVADARDLAENPVFLAKLGAIGLAGLNVLTLHRLGGAEGAPRPAVRAAAVMSLVVWTGVVGLGRWIAYV